MSIFRIILLVMLCVNTINADLKIIKYDDGTTKAQFTISDSGFIHGDYISYYPNGNIKVKGKYFKGKRVETWIYYNEKGEQVYLDIFDTSGNFIERKDSSIGAGNDFDFIAERSKDPKREIYENDFTLETSFELTVSPDSAEVFINGVFIGKGSKKVTNIKPGKYKLLVKNKDIKKATIITIVQNENNKLHVFVGRPIFILATGWECNFSQDGVLSGPLIEIGFKIERHLFSGSIQWGFTNRLEQRGYFINDHSHFGGGVVYNYDVYTRRIFSFSVGLTAGYWEQDRNKYTGKSVLNENEEEEIERYHTLWGGPVCRVRLGPSQSKIYLIAKYSALMGIESRQGVSSNSYNPFSLKNIFGFMIWFEL